MAPPPPPPPGRPATLGSSAADKQQAAINAWSEIGIANLPNQLHKIVSRKGANFTVMVVGESGLGKTTLVNTLFTTAVLEPKDFLRDSNEPAVPPRTTSIEITRAIIEEKGFGVRLTVVDTPGFGDWVDNSASWQPILKFLDDQHESYFRQESQPRRQQKTDMRVHACLYFIPPNCQTLRPLDVVVMKEISRRTNLIPIIAKADTVSPRQMALFKERIRDAIAYLQIAVYTCPIESEDEEVTTRNIEIMSSMPFSVIGSLNEISMPDGRRVLGREYIWGVAEVENEQHCDFRKLRSLLIRTHMHDLIQTTEDIHYENYRMDRLENRGAFVDEAQLAKARALFERQIKAEEEKFRQRLAEKVQVEEARFRQWEARLVEERVRLMKNLETEHSQLKLLAAEVEQQENLAATRSRK